MTNDVAADLERLICDLADIGNSTDVDARKKARRLYTEMRLKYSMSVQDSLAIEPNATSKWMVWTESDVEIFPEGGGTRVARLDGPDALATANAIVAAHNGAVEPPAARKPGNDPGIPFYATLRTGSLGDGLHETHLVCRFKNGEKFSAAVIDYECNELAEFIREAIERHNAPTDEPSADARDAARYRWLRLRDSEIPGPAAYTIYPDHEPLFEQQLDAALDEAIATENREVPHD